MKDTATAFTVKWTSVTSNAIVKVGYDYSTKKMYVYFKDGDFPYTYCNVSSQIYHDFKNVHSVGSYYHRYIKGHYQC